MNLAGEYMDVVLALTFEWYDLRKCSMDIWKFKAKYNTFYSVSFEHTTVCGSKKKIKMGYI